MNFSQRGFRRSQIISVSKRLWILFFLITAFSGHVSTHMACAQSSEATTESVADPGGSKTGAAKDLADASAAPDDETKKSLNAVNQHSMYGPGMQFLADSVGQNRVAINMAWLLIAGFLVMFMQAGFALVETGFTRAKNACHTMMMNFCVYFLGALGFWAVGYALMYGAAGSNAAAIGGIAPFADATSTFSISGLGSLFSTNGFFLSGSNYDVGVCAMFLFQLVFMDTAATIPTGAMAERWKFGAFIVFAFFASMILYPIFGHWAWGGGWLSQLGNNFGLGVGYVDFAGSGVVHCIGGFCGLAGAMVLGPRLGKYNRDGTANAIPGHNIPLALLGVIILGFGWFGFNAGSTFGAAGAGNLRIGVIAVTTLLGSAGGALSAMLYMYWRSGKPDPSMIGNGFLAGLVAITGSAAFISPSVAVLVGAVGGLIMCWSVAFLDVVRVDDPVGAVAVHAGAGLWGVLAVGIFADGTYGAGWNGTLINGQAAPLIGLLHGGTGQFIAQLIGAVASVVWGFGLSYVFFKVQHLLFGIRSSREDEIGGLDIPDIGIVAYPPELLDELDYDDTQQPAGSSPALRTATTG
jgi:ammonium transporter, Amt family